MDEGATALSSDVLSRRLERTTKKIAILEGMIEDQTRRLYLAHEEIREKSVFLESILANMPSGIVVTDENSHITAQGGSTQRLTGLNEAQIIGMALSDLLVGEPVAASAAGEERQLRQSGGSTISVAVATSPIVNGDDVDGHVIVMTDLTERHELEMQLRHAQKLESVGQMAAGVAHEINTPIQFVGDSVTFLAEAITDTLELVGAYGELRKLAAGVPELAAKAAELEELEDEADLEFVTEEAPRSIERTREGVRRVAKIVAAMKQFSHPGGGALVEESLNDLIETTLTVSKHEYKYIAEVALDLREVPPVPCDRGDIGQVILNLVVNAAHAIEAHGAASPGQIRISTIEIDGGVQLEVSDTGGGVPEEIRNRIFDPFFTTKAPGKGTGQGLSIARTLIVDKHKGRLELDVEDGIGSTFRVWLPVAG